MFFDAKAVTHPDLSEELDHSRKLDVGSLSTSAETTTSTTDAEATASTTGAKATTSTTGAEATASTTGIRTDTTRTKSAPGRPFLL
jgi:hypothetical protein